MLQQDCAVRSAGFIVRPEYGGARNGLGRSHRGRLSIAPHQVICKHTAFDVFTVVTLLITVLFLRTAAPEALAETDAAAWGTRQAALGAGQS